MGGNEMRRNVLGALGQKMTALQREQKLKRVLMLDYATGLAGLLTGELGGMWLVARILVLHRSSPL